MTNLFCHYKLYFFQVYKDFPGRKLSYFDHKSNCLWKNIRGTRFPYSKKLNKNGWKRAIPFWLWKSKILRVTSWKHVFSQLVPGQLSLITTIPQAVYPSVTNTLPWDATISCVVTLKLFRTTPKSCDAQQQKRNHKQHVVWNISVWGRDTNVSGAAIVKDWNCLCTGK